ncbi:hypothetical protein [Rhizobium sp. NPDC090279]|uniref:hypothetical protein n=1 Tax=Rhizobium sp. NPDC090279 TaxID=3364499 RepID=UPI00383AA3B6
MLTPAIRRAKRQGDGKLEPFLDIPLATQPFKAGKQRMITVSRLVSRDSPLPFL